MANIRTRNKTDIFDRLDQAFEAMGLTYNEYDSFRNIFSDIISSELFALNNEFYNRFQALQISNASETDLDELAFNLFNLERLPAAKANSFVPEQNVEFRLSSDKANPVVIPEGTKISKQDSFEIEDFYFVTTDQAIIPAGERSVYVNVIATEAGSEYNIGSNMLKHWENESIDLSNLELSCTNNFPIINGADLESDRNFRNRCSLYIQSSINKNSDFINKTLYEVPGVLEAVQHQGYYGLGTNAYSARGAGRFSNPSFKRIAEERMNTLLRTGERIKLVDDIIVNFTIELKILTSDQIGDREKVLIEDQIKNAINAKFLNVGNQINFSTLSREIESQLTNYSFSSRGGSIFRRIKVSKSATRYLGTGESNTYNDELSQLDTYILKSYEVPYAEAITINIRQVQ